MESTRGDRRLMFFIAFASFIACLVAIAALVLAAILISMVRSANAPTASKLDTAVQEISKCDGNQCLNNGKCVDKRNSFNCICPEGFIGNRCETDVNECDSNLCLNNGTCVDKINSFDCSCPGGFTGNRCETAINECDSNPCLNNGTCVDKINSFNCSCPEGFIGNRCETDVNDCDSNPCLNNGTCVDKINSFNCSCPGGFTGNRCETDINECDSNPCPNNATCVDKINSFNCSCPGGFTGSRCETDINECASNPCLSNGTCEDKINRFHCTCPEGWIGKRCATESLLNSTIITDNEFYHINLRKFLEPAVGNDSEWLLCFRASIHGFSVDPDFHSRCDGKTNTVMIIQANQNYVFGGYSDRTWDNNGGFRYSNNSFVFSLRNSEGLGPFKNNVTKPSEAIYSGSNGIGFGGQDIWIRSDSKTSAVLGKAYYVPKGVSNKNTIMAGTIFFTPNDWEVFYLA